MKRASTLGLALALASSACGQEVSRVDHPPADLKALPTVTTGRAVTQPDCSLLRQWPGTYFRTAFTGDAAFFRVGPGEVALRISVDGGAPVPLTRPAPGTYRVGGLTAGTHQLRVEVASESQAEPTVFGGFLAPAGTRAAAVPRHARQIEFIGDSHTVGYGNRSGTRQCTEEAVWETTDTAAGLAPLTARHYDADYQVNAISGRGIVRNYNGGAADTLPRAYPFGLFKSTRPADAVPWHPQVIVVALGTNDFSTPLHAGEKWPTREALHADFEDTYVRFVQGLRARNARALILLWATDMADGEIEAEVARVADRLRRGGDRLIDYVPVNGLGFTGCNHHPGLADDAAIAAALASRIDAWHAFAPAEPGLRPTGRR